ncbi:MAG: hypothetical protein KJ600_00450 [Nanoarchaeota archaeon]|nr:hypothetical protein [Nanoarchaeota archaeon]MBU1103013.1 hypothetical protein [Nanoarchaeota archaeon]
MDKELIKQAFRKVKENITTLQAEINQISQEIKEIKRTLSVEDNQTNRRINQTQNQTLQTDNYSEALKQPNLSVSTGNDGVQTDRQTIRQTDRHIEKFALIPKEQDPLTQIEKVTEVINSLDSLKRDLRKQFKKLTSQEMLVFSAIYHLTDRAPDVDYPTIAAKTNLSESSIRDYVQKIIKKGVPVVKTKENNKRITLSIPNDFKTMASLQTLVSLRSL